MRFIVAFCRIAVGLLFIFSGFIKLNDPLGFSFKLEEYFGADVLGLEFLIPYALPIAIALVIAEVVLGVLLLLGYRVKVTIWSLLLMIIFFTFLTFYSAYFNKVTDCGCFGDAIPLTPWQSFIKDVVLLVLILVLFLYQEKIRPIASPRVSGIAAAVALLACGWFAYHVLNHLPVFDFRPYKVGANIAEGMTIPADAPKPVFEYRWTFKKNDGSHETIVNQGAYPTIEGEFVDVETEMLDEGYVPPIHDFSIERDGIDFTEKALGIEKAVFVVAYNLSKSDVEGFEAIAPKLAEAKAKGYRIFGLTASANETPPLPIDFFFCDETALKTIVRSNPGLLKLSKGTIVQKLHFNDVESLSL